MKQYDSNVGRFHIAKETIKEKWGHLKEHCGNLNEKELSGGENGAVKNRANELKEKVITRINHGDKEYNHLYR